MRFIGSTVIKFNRAELWPISEKILNGRVFVYE